VNPPMGQVIGGWIGAMIVLGIAGGWLFAPTEVTLHTVPLTPETATSSETSPERPAAPAADSQPAGRGRGEP
jgi:hypothetical protein